MDRGPVHLERRGEDPRRFAVRIPPPDLSHLLVRKDPVIHSRLRVVVVPEGDQPEIFEPAVLDISVYVVDMQIQIDRQFVQGSAGPADVDRTVLGDGHPESPVTHARTEVSAPHFFEPKEFPGFCRDDLALFPVDFPCSGDDLREDDPVGQPGPGAGFVVLRHSSSGRSFENVILMVKV